MVNKSFCKFRDGDADRCIEDWKGISRVNAYFSKNKLLHAP